MVTELCDGTLKKEETAFTLAQSTDICKQLLEGLQQLEKSSVCHNDLKPDNIFFKTREQKYKNGDSKIEIKIGDFGTANRSGGTPGWTWPRFLSERQPGRSDMYSTGLVILYMMCESRELFYRIRDNYVGSQELWLERFRIDPLIELVLDMISLKPSIQQCIQRWDEISDQLEILTESSLCMNYSIPRYYFDIQDEMNRAGVELVKATHLDR